MSETDFFLFSFSSKICYINYVNKAFISGEVFYGAMEALTPQLKVILVI